MKKWMSAFLCLVCVFSYALPALAASDEAESVRYIEETVVEEPVIVPELVGTTLQDGIMPCDYYNEIPRLGEKFITEKTVYVTPSGQPSLGYVGGSGAFVFFFQTGGSSVDVSFTVDGKIFSFTVESGSQTSTGSGYGAYVPSAAGRYKFQFIKEYTITTKRYDYYQYNEYKYSMYIHDKEYALSHRWVKL